MKEYIVQAYAPETIATFDAHNAPELIRCKNCLLKDDDLECRLNRDMLEHGGHRTEAYDDWFCADGRKKDG